MKHHNLLRQLIDSSQLLDQEGKKTLESFLNDEVIPDRVLQAAQIILEAELELCEADLKTIKGKKEKVTKDIEEAREEQTLKSNEIRKKLPKHLEEIVQEAINTINKKEEEEDKNIESKKHATELSQADAIRARLLQ